MTRKCVIEGCASKSGNPQHRGVTFHSFPFDSKTREKWIVNCRLPADKNITKSVLVCSRHFRRADFQPVKSNKYLLKQGAMPTIFPWGKLDYVEPTTAPASPNPEGSQAVKSESMETDATEKKEEGEEVYAKAAKRPAADTGEDEKPKVKLLKMSTPETSSFVQSPVLVAALQADNNISSESGPSTSGIRKMETMTGFTPGVRLEAQDFNGVWHNARIIEVDNDDREVLIRFEKSGKSKGSSGVEEWIPMNSSRLRQKAITPTSSSKAFILGEKCLARWSGSRRFPATISKILPNDMYEVLFDDGYVKMVKGNHISKIKPPAEKVKSGTLSGKSKQPVKKDWPLISISSLNLEELNLPVIPKDGEWCCHWVNDQPIGQEGFLTVGDHKKPTVIVQDWRLPPNWTKHMYQRSNVLGKWDVILVNPQGKRFRSKADLKQFIEDQGQVYNPDIYDFSIHRRRAKDIGAYVYTRDYKPPSTQPAETAATGIAPVVSTVTAPQPSPVIIPQVVPIEAAPSPLSKAVEEEIPPLEDGYVYVGSLKVQIIDNLFRCPHLGCNKNFRKENHLQIHIKHYHEDIAKLLGVCPNMQELACKRTIGTATEEPLPKNHLSNAQFFAKLHQQDLQLRTHRKSMSTTIGGPLSTAPSHEGGSSLLDSSEVRTSPAILEVSSPKMPDAQATPPFEVITTPLSSSKVSPSATPYPHSTGDDTFIPEVPPKSQPKPKKAPDSSRRSSRQKITKKYLTSNSLDSSLIAADPEETRHSFNATPEQKSSAKKSKQPIQLSAIAGTVAGDSNQDGTSHTTGSIPENSQSPKYINENGEIIKIVRMKQEEIINCLCSYAEEDGLMIQCELCLCWQHGICNGIEKESQVPEKYICYICRNPQRGRSSLKYIHDQDWLYDGKLPVASYHAQPPTLEERFELLKKTHTLTGNLLEMKRFLHSLKVKINIAENKDHPKMYLWAKIWESSPIKECKAENALSGEVKVESAEVKLENMKKGEDGKRNVKTEAINVSTAGEKSNQRESNKEATGRSVNYQQPTIPQPETPIDPVECQHRLLDHIQKQQSSVMDCLQNIESQIMEIESLDNNYLDSDDCSKARETLSVLIRDLEVMKNIAKINTVTPIFVAY